MHDLELDANGYIQWIYPNDFTDEHKYTDQQLSYTSCAMMREQRVCGLTVYCPV
jgi:hypothetical protein